MSENTARSVLVPSNPETVLRVAFLYVGQGSCIVLNVRDAEAWRTLVVDSNLDESNGGIDVPALVKDLSGDGHIHAFINTHPHDDHLNGLKELSESVVIDNVWHSGHKPSKKYGNYHTDLTKLIKDVKERKGAVIELTGSRSESSLFDATYHVLAPAEHVGEEVNEEDPEDRYRRIHENCTVFRVGKGDSWVLITGDADLVAFREHITEYHKDRLRAFVLDASHHGSRSFFVAKEGDDPYLDALKAIGPKYVVISAPAEEESRHDHPHPDAVKLYADHVGQQNVFHTGADRESFFVDVFADGSHGKIETDKGQLAEVYGLDRDDRGGGGGNGARKAPGPFVAPAAPPALTPRKYG